MSNFKALPQPNFEKVFKPQLKHEKTAPKPFSFEEKDKERWQKKEEKIHEVYKEEEKVRKFQPFLVSRHFLRIYIDCMSLQFNKN